MRHDWYQTDSSVVINVLAKNQKQEDVTVNITEQMVQVDVAGDAGGSLSFPLWQHIKARGSSYRILSSKIEIKLYKTSGNRWPSLEQKDPIKTVAVGAQKNWDSIAAAAAGEDDEKEGDQALNSLFQDIYSKADESTKRAMNKSYMESGGTVLSTNWSEVGSQKIDVKPPDGMEYKQWEQ